MKSISFVDLEVRQSGAVGDFGCIKDTGAEFHAKSIAELRSFLSGTEYLCGHNLLGHDIRYLHDVVQQCNIHPDHFIDTLYLSPLLFPRKPYHALLKDEKLLTDELNNPLSDAIKAKNLLYDEVSAFGRLNEPMKRILYLLLRDQEEFCGFFHFLDYQVRDNLTDLIQLEFARDLCSHAILSDFINKNPIELAYCLVQIQIRDPFSILPAWVLRRYPETERIMYLLRDVPCLSGCQYCNQALDPQRGLMFFFGFDAYRTFGGKPLQEAAVRDALHGKSILAIFPTGGGKSITFQVPALMNGKNTKGLTVVISPLQSLMKDQVDNLERSGITEATTINGLIDPLQRAEAIERVRDGSVSLLYISPELLRSRTIEKLLLGRRISRFVIDEAHCLSAWGQDFRVDYLNIANFINNLQQKKILSEAIPVSCFTATAKPSVIEDIKHYFKSKLGLDLVVHQTDAPRTNLRYQVIVRKTDVEKYQELRRLLDAKRCPSIVYVSRTKLAEKLADTLTRDGFPARPYHGQMDSRIKTENQNDFLAGEISIIVATSAFGMGVDKKDVGLVVHYQISDSLEQYVQESGRAGRDQHMTADCYVLFNEDDLDGHFVLLNQNRINIKEIQQIWQAIKNLTKYRCTVSQSALELARKAGWDETVETITTRVTTAIAALEEAGYLRRSYNMPRIFADSILCRTAGEADEMIRNSAVFNEAEKMQAIRIMKNLIGGRSRSKAADGSAETRVDYLADILGLAREQVIDILNQLRQIGLLADTKDLIAYLSRESKDTRSSHILISYSAIEQALLTNLKSEETTYSLKEINELLEHQGCKNCSVEKVKVIFRYWQKKKLIAMQYLEHDKKHIRLAFREQKEVLLNKQKKRLELAGFVIQYLFNLQDRRQNPGTQADSIVDFSVHEILKAYSSSPRLMKQDYSLTDVEDAILYLSHIEALIIEGGFMVLYNPMTLERLEEDQRRRYRKEDYQKLALHYEVKMQQIHIVGEYALRMIQDYQGALQFVDDYFHLQYSSFLSKYFRGQRLDDIKRNITPQKFHSLFGELSPSQLRIIKDAESQYIAVLAGPGSGKTRVLVHKLASLILMEDVKYEQLLMLTFSRAAVTEFKIRLNKMVHKAANFIDIKTFHAFCFDLLGQMGTLEKSEQIIEEAIERINSGDIEPNQITKTVLVIDEAQDMSQNEYRLIDILMLKNEDMRVIAVGDDDQNIYAFRGSSAGYLKRFMQQKQATKYELLDNYRSRCNLVDFTNQFVTRIPGRLKSNQISARTTDNGNIRIVQYKNIKENSLFIPFVEDLATSERSGSTCALVSTNDQALQLAGMLQKRNLPAKLIQSNDEIRLMNLAEIRFFISMLQNEEDCPTIDHDTWDKTRNSLQFTFSRSAILDTCLKLTDAFSTIYPDTKYKTDFETFIRESRLEDFSIDGSDTIYVGTMHKAKGKEFDQVFLLLDQKYLHNLDPEKCRLLYVAFTRAKSGLVIHYNDNYLDTIKADQMERIVDTNTYPMPVEIAFQAGYQDVHLDYFINENRQQSINNLQNGDILEYKEGICLDRHRQPILKLSKKFMERINRAVTRGFYPKHARVGFIVYWKKEDQEEEWKIVLPEIHFIQRQV